MKISDVSTVFGVDFSGAKLAGRNTWVARCAVERRRSSRLVLEDVQSLESLAGDAERDLALAHLVSMIKASAGAMWGMDFPFGLPIEIEPMGSTWRKQLRFVRDWADTASPFGTWCVKHALSVGEKMHIRRLTDTILKTPFDCYHYRIIFQTFHGMRDVLAPLANARGVSILPFQYNKFPAARSVVVESCPGSTLKRLELPHQNYKQPAGGPLTAKRRRVRGEILSAMNAYVAIDPTFRRRIMRNPGGDALDAVIAAVGAWDAYRAADHDTIRRHARYRREGYLYC